MPGLASLAAFAALGFLPIGGYWKINLHGTDNRLQWDTAHIPNTRDPIAHGVTPAAPTTLEFGPSPTTYKFRAGSALPFSSVPGSPRTYVCPPSPLSRPSPDAPRSGLPATPIRVPNGPREHEIRTSEWPKVGEPPIGGKSRRWTSRVQPPPRRTPRHQRHTAATRKEAEGTDVRSLSSRVIGRRPIPP